MKAKNIFLAIGALIISASAFSQVDTTKKDTARKKDSLHKMDTTTVASQQINNESSVNKSETTSAQNNPTVATAETQAQPSVPKPNHGRYYIPVLGVYRADESSATSTATETKSVTVTPDETNPGKVWVEGLTDTRFYALLKTVPGVYKIPTQNQSDKPVAEGEIRYDENNKSISICLGCGYHDNASQEEATPPVATSTAKNNRLDKSAKKAKSTIINFTGVKTDNGSVSLR